MRLIPLWKLTLKTEFDLNWNLDFDVYFIKGVCYTRSVKGYIKNSQSSRNILIIITAPTHQENVPMRLHTGIHCGCDWHQSIDGIRFLEAELF